jgi:electron transfer flavoprotein alpha subunit
MEPNKLETQFKEQLNSREIKPSEMAWSKLDAMLSVADSSNSEQAKQKQKTKFPWMFMAASFVGFVLIGTVYFSQKGNTIENQKNEVVIQNSVTTKTTVVPDNSIKLKTEDEKGLVANVVQKSTSGTNKTPILKEKSIIVNNNSNQNQVAEVSITNQKAEQKAEQKSIKSQISDVTVDELLAVAGNPSKKENQLNQKLAVYVNAGNLLSQVDGELELSFREKVINKVSKNYQSVKVALSNRNLE